MSFYRPNFSPSRPSGWFPLAVLATQNSFDSSSDPVAYKATATATFPGAGAHCSVFFTIFPTAGKTYRFEADVDILQIPATGPAVYFVWADSLGNGLGEYAGDFATQTGPQTVSFEMQAPPSTFSMRVVFGNGGPTADGRSNLMFVPDVLEFELDASSATMYQDGLLLSPPGGYFDGGQPGAFWDATPHDSVSLQRWEPLEIAGGSTDNDTVKFAAATLKGLV